MGGGAMIWWQTIKRKLSPRSESEPETHDYTKRCWGWSYEIIKIEDGGKRLHLAGWGEDIKQGDYMLMEHDGKTTRYVFKEIKYCADPTDMWFAWLSFAPREAVSQ